MTQEEFDFQDDDELQAHLNSMCICGCCKDVFHEKNQKEKFCNFCLSFGNDMIESFASPKKHEKTIDHEIRRKLFQSIKNICELFEHSYRTNVVEDGLTQVVYYFDLSEYNHDFKASYNPESFDLNEPLEEVVKNYKNNDEQGLSVALEKLKFNILNGVFGKNVKNRLKNKHIKCYLGAEKICLECGEAKEKYMTDNFCHSCTLISDAIMF